MIFVIREPLRFRSSAGLRDLMARMGHDSGRVAMIYQHEAQSPDKTITDAINTHAHGEQHETTTMTTARRNDHGPGSPFCMAVLAAVCCSSALVSASSVTSQPSRPRRHRVRPRFGFGVWILVSGP
jgi:hypothetical protein